MIELSTTEQSTNADKELIQVLKNPGPINTFKIVESQFHAINRISTLFNNIQPHKPKKPNTKVVLREVPMVAPPRVPVIVQATRMPMTMVSLRVMEPRIPLVSQ